MTTVEQHKQICRSHTWYSVQERKIGTVRWDYERAAEKTGVADQIRKEAARRLNLKQDWLFHKMVAYSLHFLSKPFRRRRDFEGCRRVAAEYAEKPHRLNAKLAEDNDAKDLGDVTAKMLEQAEDLVVKHHNDKLSVLSPANTAIRKRQAAHAKPRLASAYSLFSKDRRTKLGLEQPRLAPIYAVQLRRRC